MTRLLPVFLALGLCACQPPTAPAPTTAVNPADLPGPDPKPRIGATIGDFVATMDERLPNPVALDSIGAVEISFRRGDLVFSATFWSNQCHQIIVQHTSTRGAGTLAAANSIIHNKGLSSRLDELAISMREANGNGLRWTLERSDSESKTWLRADESVQMTSFGAILHLSTLAYLRATQTEDDRHWRSLRKSL